MDSNGRSFNNGNIRKKSKSVQNMNKFLDPCQEKIEYCRRNKIMPIKVQYYLNFSKSLRHGIIINKGNTGGAMGGNNEILTGRTKS